MNLSLHVYNGPKQWLAGWCKVVLCNKAEPGCQTTPLLWHHSCTPGQTPFRWMQWLRFSPCRTKGKLSYLFKTDNSKWTLTAYSNLPSVQRLESMNDLQFSFKLSFLKLLLWPFLRMYGCNTRNTLEEILSKSAAVVLIYMVIVPQHFFGAATNAGAFRRHSYELVLSSTSRTGLEPYSDWLKSSFPYHVKMSKM